MLAQFKDNSQSPFDSIKKVSESSREYWSARELMQTLGYVQWRRFNEVIETAKDNLEILGLNTLENFLPVEAKSSGRTGLDYHLSRLACYHVALSCDPRGKDAVKLAKHYFVVKAREAEVIIPKQNEKLVELQLHNENLKIENDNLRRRESLELRRESNITMHGKELAAFIAGADVVHIPGDKVQETLLVDDYGKVKASYSGIGITALAAKYGFGKGVKANNQCRMWLKSIGIEDDEWDNELTAHYTPKLPRELLPMIDEAFKRHQGDRQLYLGE